MPVAPSGSFLDALVFLQRKQLVSRSARIRQSAADLARFSIPFLTV